MPESGITEKIFFSVSELNLHLFKYAEVLYVFSLSAFLNNRKNYVV